MLCDAVCLSVSNTWMDTKHFCLNHQYEEVTAEIVQVHWKQSQMYKTVYIKIFGDNLTPSPIVHCLKKQPILKLQILLPALAKLSNVALRWLYTSILPSFQQLWCSVLSLIATTNLKYHRLECVLSIGTCSSAHFATLLVKKKKKRATSVKYTIKSFSLCSLLPSHNRSPKTCFKQNTAVLVQASGY